MRIASFVARLTAAAFMTSPLAGLAASLAPVAAENGMVVTAQHLATRTGVDVLKDGGNAVDAAVATAFALGVLEPNASGLGGGGFMIVKLANMKEAVVVDFRETAPAAAKADMYRIGDDGKVAAAANVVGGLASGVPGEVAGLLY